MEPNITTDYSKTVGKLVSDSDHIKSNDVGSGEVTSVTMEANASNGKEGDPVHESYKTEDQKQTNFEASLSVSENLFESRDAKIPPSEPETKRPRLEIAQPLLTDGASTESSQPGIQETPLFQSNDDAVRIDEHTNQDDTTAKCASRPQDEVSTDNNLDGVSQSTVISGRGTGTKLGTIPEVVAQFKRGKRSTPAIRKLHQILFSEIGNDQTRIDNILAWNGLSESDPINVLEKLNACMSSSELREIGRKVLGLVSGADGKDTKAAWSSAIADILNEPTPQKFHRFGSTSGSNKARGPSGFQLFCGIEREKLKTENPSLSHRALMKVLGEKWRNISDEDKQNFQAKSQALRSTSGVTKLTSEGKVGTYSASEETLPTTSAIVGEDGTGEDVADQWNQEEDTDGTHSKAETSPVQLPEESITLSDGELMGEKIDESKPLPTTLDNHVASPPVPATTSNPPTAATAV